MAIAQGCVAFEILHQAGDIRTPELAIAVAIAGYVEVAGCRIHITTVGRLRTEAFEITHPKSDIAADPVAVAVDIAGKVIAGRRGYAGVSRAFRHPAVGLKIESAIPRPGLEKVPSAVSGAGIRVSQGIHLKQPGPPAAA